MALAIAYYVPCYRGQLRVETAYTMVRDALWAQSQGHEIQPFHRSTCSIDAARNYGLGVAIRADADLLLMIDADVYVQPPASGLALLVARWRETGAACIGAAVPSRRGGLNCDPPRGSDGAPVFPGVVGTGLMLIDVRQVRSISPPWFTTTLTPDGERVQTGEDIAFCQLAQRRGLTVLVDSTVPTGHMDEVGLQV